MSALYHARRMRLLTLLADVAFPPRETETCIRTLTFDRLASFLSPACWGANDSTRLSLFPYTQSAVQACIIEAKFQGNQRAAELLGRALHEFLSEFLAEAAAFETQPPVIVPLPLSAERLAQRGYNQVERILRSAVPGLPGISIETDILRRTRDTKPQTSVSAHERETNIAGAFAVTRACDPSRTYIVLDDVITTGYTMHAACEALRAGGAKRLLPLALAH